MTLQTLCYKTILKLFNENVFPIILDLACNILNMKMYFCLEEKIVEAETSMVPVKLASKH